MPDALPRIRELRSLLPPTVHVQVDGGVGEENIAEIRAAGANLFVAGSAIFAADDPAGAYRRLLEASS
jgi:ribulose-phosphate 3-epimerase